jgi:hypothetical protein
MKLMIYLMKNGGGSGSHRFLFGYSSGSENAFFQQVRIHINNGDLYRAEQMLNQTDKRTAEWFYSKRSYLPEERAGMPRPDLIFRLQSTWSRVMRSITVRSIHDELQ